jgi:hypothetical protein
LVGGESGEFGGKIKISAEKSPKLVEIHVCVLQVTRSTSFIEYEVGFH